MPNQPRTSPAGSVDLDEVAKLVAALERDLARVKQGSQDVQALRDEVRALGEALDAAPDHEHVGHRLRNIHGMIDNVVDTVVEDSFKAADYVARIGRMLGL